ncbi:RNA polymerase sigma factor [Pinibacter aurantiacus]|uniref:Sigma-70 family RNA polymerase sigma factor n=1 Tax=Pinibacter aurantiacus TaxID=2851599 RepID=A0A9E2W5P5_9BACT|nr:sigma-70 family RNA polymerase sigma factor [Pinibacter aurantiacus]MBV4359104.1 sigma-70 family RNA polymerase sigma factor [Pinibacter aurantiacus]
MSPLQNKTNDDQLIALQQGDEKALSYFFNKYYPALVHYANSITMSKELSEEIVADSFVKLWDKHDRFFAENSLRSFLYLVTRNASLNSKRSGKNERSLYDLMFVEDEVSSNDFELLLRSETYHAVLLAMNDLPKRYQDIFQQLYMEGKSYAEIADGLNTSVNNIRIQKMRALILLRKKLPFTALILLIVL